MKNILLTFIIFAFALTSLSGQANCILVCNSNVNISLDNMGEATIEPEMVLEGFLDPDCVPFYQVGLQNAAGDIIYPLGDSIVVQCSDVGDYVGVVSIVDNGTVYNSCWVNLTIEDKLDVCTFNTAPGTFPLNISGKKNINYASKVFLNGNELNKVVAGLFEVPKSDIIPGQNEITFESVNSTMNGISTLDYVLIQRIIVELQVPNDNLLVAGDFDKSNFIGIKDLVDIRDLILGIQSDNSFRFFHTDADFSMFDPFDFGTDIYSFTFNDTDTSSIAFDFNVMQGGDINDNYNFRSEDDSENRGPKSELTFSDVRVEAGQPLLVDFFLDSDILISGIQASFDMSNFTNVELLSNYTDEELKSNAIDQEYRLSFVSDPADRVEFSLILTPKLSGDLSDLLRLTAEFTQELVTPSLSTKKIELVAKSITNTTEIFANGFDIFPNPMLDFTQISLSASDTYTIYIQDLTGRLVLGDTFSGSTYTVYNNQFDAAGVYMVSLKSTSFDGKQKLVVIK